MVQRCFDDCLQETATAGSALEIHEQIVAQGNKVRDLKSAKADKAVLDADVKNLLNLKAKYKSVTGEDWKPNATPPVKSAPVVVIKFFSPFTSHTIMTFFQIDFLLVLARRCIGY